MVLIIGETFVHLRACDVWKAARDHGVHGLSILEQTDHVMDAHASSFHDGFAPPNAGLAGNVTVPEV
jgi:hypothetical protein